MRSMECFDVKKFVSRWRKELIGLAVLVVVVLFVLLVLWLFGQITFVEQEVTIVQIITAILVLVGMYWTSRRVVAAERTVRVGQANVRVGQANARVAEEGHITDRFTKAIAQLGDKEMAIRLGGIYALERIAKDSEKDHGPIMEVLTAYVRDNAPKQEEYAEKAAQGPTTDIKAILTVIGRRKATEIKRPGDILDLTNTHLHGLLLFNANLSGVNLYGANLTATNLVDTNLSRTILRKADLSKAILGTTENLTAEQVRSAISCSGATLPDYLPDSVKDLTKLPPPA